MLNLVEKNKTTLTSEQISNLTLKAKQNSICNMTNDPIDWSLPIALPKWLSEKQYVRMVSNLIYGENSTVRACKMLQTHFGPGVYSEFISTQISDEETHAAIYNKYLDKLGHSPSPSESWCNLIEKCLKNHTTPIELVIAFHISPHCWKSSGRAVGRAENTETGG